MGDDLPAYRLLVSSLFSSPGSIIPGGIAGVLTPYLCWLSTDMPIFAQLTQVVLAVITIVAIFCGALDALLAWVTSRLLGYGA